MAYTQTKAYKDAAESFRQAALYKPDWADAHFRLGMISYVLGRRSQSLDSYKKLLELNSPLANQLYRVIKDESDPGAVAQIVINDIQVASLAPPAATPSASVVPESENAATGKTPETKPSSAPLESADVSATSTYKIGVGDVLDIRLLNSRLTGSSLYSVIEGGVIDLPIAGGVVHVGGFTTEQVQANIVSELKRRSVEEGAHVSVGIRQYASHTIIITGLVNSQGTKILRREAVPLYVVMAEAQPRLDAARISIMRAGSAQQVLDLSDPATLNTLVRSGDVINVSARQQEFYYIAGRVNYPGQKTFQPGITLLQAILAAGGVSKPHDNGIEVSRAGADGRLSTTKFKLKEIKSGKVEDPKLHAGDRIEVIN
jgi:protein involved in polysaccharide export with SLBB domain